ncbi:tyrosine-protein kinase Wzc [Serratia sp. BFP-2025]|uniref:tyrosine-protein kinase Wzc n=1 Tax=Serratia sp. BFP-2025 TaxID=3433707 RepID=UPI003D7EDF93
MSEKNRVNLSGSDKTEEIDLGRLFGELLDNRWLIIGVTSVFIALGITYSLFATPIYRADAIVQVERNVGSSLLSNISQMLPNGQPEAAPEIELLKSRMILNKTIDDLNLRTIVKEKHFPLIGKGLARLMGQPVSNLDVAEFVPSDSWNSDSYLELVVLNKNEFTVSVGDGKAIHGEVGKLLTIDGNAILVERINAKPDTVFSITKQSEQKAFSGLLDRYNVVDKGKDTGVLGLTLIGSDPVKVEATLNSILQNYVYQNVQRKSEEDAKSLDFLRVQLPKVRVSLDTAEDKLNKFRQKNESVDLSLEAKSVLDSIVSVDTQLNELTFKEAEISKLYTKEHPSYRALLEKRKTLEIEKDKLNKRINGMPQTQQEILRLSRDVKSGQEVYMQLLNKEQELNISKASKVGNVRIIDSAITQEDPVKPQKAVILFLSFFFGIILSVFYVLIRAYLHRGIENPEELESIGVNVYASVPLSEWQRKRDQEFTAKNKNRNADSNTLLAFGNPADLAIEAIRSLRTSLHFAMMEAKNNILMISGASPGIGKTFISANLAAVVAQTGTKVLFIDCDMRKGYAHELLGVDGKNGLSDVLSGKSTVENIIKKANNFDFIARGMVPPNPSELLMHNRFPELLAWASKHYDLVVVDTPPILAVTDAAIVGKQAGTSLMVAKFEQNTAKEVEISIKRLSQNGVDIKGVILNAVIRKSSNYYSYGYDYYDYSYKSSKN